MINKNKKFQITCSFSQLMMIANAVEDWHRFLAGQCEMSNATMLLPVKDHHASQEALNEYVRPHIVPELNYGASYKWSGGSCPNEHQRKAIAMSYGIYREILHFIAVQNNHNNVLASETLTCPEQGELITIKQIE